MGGGALADHKNRPIRFTGNERSDASHRRQVEVYCPTCGEPKWVDFWSLKATGHGAQHKRCANMRNGMARSAESRVIKDNYRKYSESCSDEKKNSNWGLKHRLRDFRLPFKLFEKLVLSPCYYCGGFTDVLVSDGKWCDRHVQD